MPVLVDGKMETGGVYGVDFGAVLSLTAALGGPIGLVADLLPGIEAIIVRSYRSDSET
jgi:hypothetical protein